MIRMSVSRRFAGLVLGLATAAGIAVGAYSLGSAPGARAPEPFPYEAPSAAAATTDAPGAPSEVPAASPSSSASSSTSSPSRAPSGALTLDQAKAVATQAAGGGRVVEASEDNDEPTGLLFDVTVLHPNGSATKVEVDAATGRIVSIKQDDHWD